MVLLFEKSGSELIKNGSIIGTHEIKVFDDSIIANDTGGIFASAKKSVAFYKNDNVKAKIETENYKGNFNEITFFSNKKELEVSFVIDLMDVHKLLFKSDIKENFIFSAGKNQIDGILEHTKGTTYFGIEYLEKRVKITHGFGIETFSLREIQSVKSDSENIFTVTVNKTNYRIAVNKSTKPILEQIIKDLKSFKEISSSKESIELKSNGKFFFGFISNDTLELYNGANLKQDYNFEIKSIDLYLGATQLLIKYKDVFLVYENTSARKLCSLLSIVPRRLYQFSNANFLYQNGKKRKLKNLVCFLDDGKYVFYSLESNSVKFIFNAEDVKVSETASSVIVLPDGLLKVENNVDFVETIDTPTIYFSESGFPVYFERISSDIRISIPGNKILEENVEKFYNRTTRQKDDMIIVNDVANLSICIPLIDYKNLFKENLYHLRLPLINEVHVEKILVSRARNISDLLLFEFFGQWQLILDYVKEKMQKTHFTEEEITQFGLYLYHATFQQRKRMEEIASKYPQFMYALSQDLMINPKLNHIYQKQQKDMFQLSAQMKSQFIEVENLLSQITYIHFNNEEYQERLKEAQNAASKKKIGVSVATGIGIGIASGGLGLLIPAMTILTEWINSGHRKELDAIQQEKEFKKNEFLFKKAIDLILHMNDYTINYHVQMVNQFTYKNLRLEAEVLVTDNTAAYKEKLLKQSIDVYAKTSLPIDYDTQLKPKKMLESILRPPAEDTNKTVKLFLE